MGNYRNESRRSPGADRYGTPGTQFPTPNPFDVVITEEADTRAHVFEPLLYGTPHPTRSDALLCYQSPVKGNATDKSPVRVYANPRLAQEPYNLVNGDDDANDKDFPVFVRSYLLLRGYAKATRGTPLQSLIGLQLTAGGTGYTPAANSSKLALSFSGGAGSGAAGFAEIVAGVIVAVVLTNTGTGYTSAPTVSAAGGTGASITALLQPATALLVSEVEQPAEEPFGGYFVRVVRTWETVPGKVVTTNSGIDPEMNTPIVVTRQLKKLSEITEGAAVSGGNLVIVEARGVDGLFAYEEVTTIFPPDQDSFSTALVETRTLAFQWPARINISQLDTYGTAIGYHQPKARLIEAKVKTYWVISNTKPTLTFDRIIGNTITINDVTYPDVLHDATSRTYLGSLVDIDATTPSYTQYVSNWIGAEKLVDGGVKDTRYHKLWKVEGVFVVME